LSTSNCILQQPYICKGDMSSNHEQN